MWKTVTMALVAMLFLPGCVPDHVAAVDDGGNVERGAGGYAMWPHRAAGHTEQVRFFKAMGEAFQLAERETDGATARDLFTGLRKGWKGYGYLAAGQGGSYSIPGYTGQAMSAALGTLPDGTCKEVTGRIAEAYGNLHQSLRHGARERQAAAAKGAGEWRDDWLWRRRNDC